MFRVLGIYKFSLNHKRSGNVVIKHKSILVGGCVKLRISLKFKGLLVYLNMKEASTKKVKVCQVVLHDFHIFLFIMTSQVGEE
jgi:hypothetical protein